VIYDTLTELFKAVDKAGLGVLYGGEAADSAKKIKKYNDSIRLPERNIKKDSELHKSIMRAQRDVEEGNLLTHEQVFGDKEINPERQKESTKLTPL